MSKSSAEPSVQRFADLDALRRQLEEVASRRNRSERTAEARRLIAWSQSTMAWSYSFSSILTLPRLL